MFSWGNKLPLAEALGLNTLKHREARDAFVKTCSLTSQAQIVNDLVVHSKSSIDALAAFDFSNVEFQKKVVGLNTASVQEREHILANVSAKLKEDKLDTSVEGSVLTVKWTVPVPVVAPVVAPAPEKPAEKEVEATDANKK